MNAVGCSKGSATSAMATLRDWSASTEEQQRAAEVLKGYSDRRTTDDLISILTAPGTRPDTRVLVLGILSSRSQPGISLALSKLLRPQNPLTLRRAAVNALRHRECGTECVDQILHYMERVSCGEPQSELAVNQSELAEQTFKDQESVLDVALQDILRENRQATLRELQEVYGLDTMHVSRFAIRVAASLSLKEACRGLTRPYLRETSVGAIRSDLDDAINKLGCEPRPR